MTARSIPRPTTSKITPIRPAKASADWRQAAGQITMIVNRTDEAQAQLHRAIHMLKMLRVIADSDILGDGNTDEIDGIGEVVECITELVRSASNQIDSATLLAPEGRS